MTSRPWGLMTVERHTALKVDGIDLHIYVDGCDVTKDCQWWDDTPGHEMAQLLKRTENGQAYAVDGELAVRRVRTFDVRVAEVQ